jgi:hypothetical protein
MFLRDSQLIPRHQQLFLIEGVATIGLAIIFAFILPNSPKTIRGHTEQEREWLAWTFRQDQGQQDHSDEITAWKGFKMAMADPKTWLLMSTLYCVSFTLGSLFSYSVTNLNRPRSILRLLSRISSHLLLPHLATLGPRHMVSLLLVVFTREILNCC